MATAFYGTVVIRKVIGIFRVTRMIPMELYKLIDSTRQTLV